MARKVQEKKLKKDKLETQDRMEQEMRAHQMDPGIPIAVLECFCDILKKDKTLVRLSLKFASPGPRPSDSFFGNTDIL